MKDLYWDKCLADEIENQSLAEIIVDWCVQLRYGRVSERFRR